MNRRELESHLQELFDGRLEGEAFENLQQELRQNPVARESYREYLHLDGLGHEVVGAGSNGCDSGLHATERGHHNDRDIRTVFGQSPT